MSGIQAVYTNKEKEILIGEDGKSEQKNMTQGNIYKIIISFSIPLILGNLLQQLYNTADSVIVGNYVGRNALAAVGSGTAIINLLISFSQGIAVGAGVLVAQAIGKNNRRRISLSIHTAISLSIVLGMVLSALGFIFTPHILTVMGTPKEIMPESITYLRNFSLGLLFNVIYNMTAGILNAVGNAKRSLMYLAIASVVNILLDMLFIKYEQWGVFGAALATNISQLLACMLSLLFLIKSPTVYKVELSKLNLNKVMTVNMLKTGLPTGIQNMVVSLSNVLVQASVNSFGTIIVSGFGVYMKIDGFNILPILSLSMVGTTFTGQNFGAGKLERITKGTKILLGIGLLYTLMIGLVLSRYAEVFVGFFTKDISVIQAGVYVMQFFCPFYFLLAILQCLCGVVRGTGRIIPTVLIFLASLCLFRVMWLETVLPLYNSIETIYIMYPVSWGLGAVLAIIYAWKSNLLQYSLFS